MKQEFPWKEASDLVRSTNDDRVLEVVSYASNARTFIEELQAELAQAKADLHNLRQENRFLLRELQ